MAGGKHDCHYQELEKKAGQTGKDLNACTEINTVAKMSQRFPSLCLQALLLLRKRLSGFQASTHIVMIRGDTWILMDLVGDSYGCAAGHLDW